MVYLTSLPPTDTPTNPQTPRQHEPSSSRVPREPALAALHFDASKAPPQETSWRTQRLLKQRSPRLLAIPSGAASASQSLIAELDKRTDDEIVQALLDNDLNTTTFIEYLQQSALGSPARLLPWLQTLAALTAKVGLLLESTRFLCSDLQLARILLHMQTSAKSICGSKRAIAHLVHSESDALLRVGERGELLEDNAEKLSTGTSFAAHCARAGKPLLIGLPGSAERTALGFNVDSGTGSRPETSVCVPCLDHLGKVIAVLQVNDKQHGAGSFGRDDLVLLQRFAIQCGISLRNAGGSQFTQPAPQGAVLTPRATVPKTSPLPPAPPSGAHPASEGFSPTRRPRKVRAEDAATQCNLLEAPPLKMLPRKVEIKRRQRPGSDEMSNSAMLSLMQASARLTSPIAANRSDRLHVSPPRISADAANAFHSPGGAYPDDFFDERPSGVPAAATMLAGSTQPRAANSAAGAPLGAPYRAPHAPATSPTNFPDSPNTARDRQYDEIHGRSPHGNASAAQSLADSMARG